MLRVRVWVPFLLLLLSLSLTLPVLAQSDNQPVPRLETVECRFEPLARGETTCYDLVVPENRHDPANTRTIRLHVAVRKALRPDDAEADPVIYLEGGPGGNLLQTIRQSFHLQSFNYRRDVIVFDQRGTGLSEPALLCPDFGQSVRERRLDDLTPVEFTKVLLADHQACRDDLVAQGIDLAGYNSLENAADVEDLRVALGYDRWNLYGVSYGARLALEVMRSYPDGIRSVILDSVPPAQRNWLTDLPANADRAFRTFFDACARDFDCDDTYPGLETDFYTLVDRLNQNPVRYQFSFLDVDYDLVVRGDAYLLMLFNKLYSATTFAAMPQVIALGLEGNHKEAGIYRAFSMEQSPSLTTGMYFTFVCADMLSGLDYATLREADAAYPRQYDAFDAGYFEDVCTIWGVPAADPVVREPVVSDLPTLVMSGEFDPITPPDYGRLVADDLRNSTYLLFPGMGHGVSFGSCARNIIAEFLTDPDETPDSRCINGLTTPRFR